MSKYISLIFLIACILQFSCNNKMEVNIPFKIVTKFPLVKDSIIGFNETISCVYYYNTSAYLIFSGSNRILTFKLKDRSVNCESRINRQLSCLSKLYGSVKGLNILEDNFYVLFLNAIVKFSSNGEILKTIPINAISLGFYVGGDSIQVFAKNDSVYRCRIDGNSFYGYGSTISFYGKFLNNDSDVFFADSYDIVHCNKKSKQIRKYEFPIANIGYEEPFLSCVSTEYYVWFPYKKRDRITLVSVNDHNKSITIGLGVDFPADVSVLEQEQGNPSFSVLHVPDSNACYLFYIDSGKMSISKLFL